MIKRITIGDNEEYLRQVSTEIDFEKECAEMMERK